MSDYQLELKQIVSYSRCRIYRQFIKTLMADRGIRVSGGSGLFYFMVLSSYTNFRTSYHRIGGISYTIYPGEWLCETNELKEWFRVHSQRQAISILKNLQERHLITYAVLGRGKLVKFKIMNWQKHNRVLDYNAPCQKDTGFFFVPVSLSNELVSYGKCSEADVVLDLWLNTIYNDEQVQGSEFGPVVYMRNGTGNPLIGYSELAERWGISRSTVGRYLKKLSGLGYLSLLTFPGTHGSAIYLKKYLSTMFQISDVLLDKDEISMALNIKISLSNDLPKMTETSVSNSGDSVSKTCMDNLLQKVFKVLTAQGFCCFDCPNFKYKLLPLSNDWEDNIFSKRKERPPLQNRFLLSVYCGNSYETLKFELTLMSFKQRQGGVIHEKE